MFFVKIHEYTYDDSLNRIRSEDFKTLEEHIGHPIQIADNVKLQRSRTERFIEVFRDQVSQNPVCFKQYILLDEILFL